MKPIMTAPTDGNYMDQAQLDYFKNKLLIKKKELIEKIVLTKEKIQSFKSTQADILDRSNIQTDMEFELKTNERYSQLLKEIEKALGRIDEGSFGYCAVTGEPIGLKRLEAIPFASMSTKALEEIETMQSGPHQPAPVFVGL